MTKFDMRTSHEAGITLLKKDGKLALTQLLRFYTAWENTVSTTPFIGHLYYCVNVLEDVQPAELRIVSAVTCRDTAKLVAAALVERGLCSDVSIPDS